MVSTPIDTRYTVTQIDTSTNSIIVRLQEGSRTISIGADILKIGSRPLGEILFDDSEIKRGHLEVGSFQNSWARRSTFTIGKTNLLVTEIFLESLYA